MATIKAIRGTITRELETDTVVLPDAWASALVNAGWTVLDPEETAQCEACETDLARAGWAVFDGARDARGEPEPAWFGRRLSLAGRRFINRVPDPEEVEWLRAYLVAKL